MKICVLGCSGSIAQGCRTTSFLVDQDLLVDAGTGVGDLHLADMALINHVVLTHAHLDHIVSLPLMLDAVASRRQEPLTVYALPETIEALRRHVFNDVIWPDFSAIPNVHNPFLVFASLSVGEVLSLGGKRVEVLPAEHTVPAVGYAVAQNEDAPHWVFSGDTSHNPAFWARVNCLPVGALVIETAFSERERDLAERSKHLCPSALARELAMMRADADYPVFITHTKPAETQQIMAEITHLNQSRLDQGLPPHRMDWLTTGQEFEL